MEENKEIIRISLAAARVNANLTQAEAGQKAGFARETIWNWENNKTSPSSKQLAKLGEIYNINTDYIFLPSRYTLSVLK